MIEIEFETWVIWKSEKSELHKIYFLNLAKTRNFRIIKLNFFLKRFYDWDKQLKFSFKILEWIFYSK